MRKIIKNILILSSVFLFGCKAKPPIELDFQQLYAVYVWKYPVEERQLPKEKVIPQNLSMVEQQKLYQEAVKNR